jgi:hypothetical protein
MIRRLLPLAALLALLSGLPPPAAAQVNATTQNVTLNDYSGTITLGGTAQTIIAANSRRHYLLVVNISSGTLWIRFDVAAVADQPSIPIFPNGSFVMECGGVDTRAVSIIGATTGQKFVAKEGIQ